MKYIDIVASIITMKIEIIILLLFVVIIIVAVFV